MRLATMLCGVLALVLGGSSVAWAGKPVKCVFPSLTFTVVNTAPGLESDGNPSALYSDGVDGTYAKMEHCGGSGDVVLSLDTTLHTMAVTLSDGPSLVGRVDVTGVEFVTAQCDLGETAVQAVTIWASDGFLKANGNNGSDMATVCKNADGSWSVRSSATASAARFRFFRGQYRYTGINEFVPFEIAVRYK
jgi:hypothetical protein